MFYRHHIGDLSKVWPGGKVERVKTSIKTSDLQELRIEYLEYNVMILIRIFADLVNVPVPSLGNTLRQSGRWDTHTEL